jgi:hypothetical protein
MTGKSPNTLALEVQPFELAAYCGLYCGAWDIYQKRIGQSGKELEKVLDAYRFNEIATQVAGLEDYETFYKNSQHHSHGLWLMPWMSERWWPSPMRYP